MQTETWSKWKYIFEEEKLYEILKSLAKLESLLCQTLKAMTAQKLRRYSNIWEVVKSC